MITPHHAVLHKLHYGNNADYCKTSMQASDLCDDTEPAFYMNSVFDGDTDITEKIITDTIAKYGCRAEKVDFCGIEIACGACILKKIDPANHTPVQPMCYRFGVPQEPLRHC